MRIILFVGRARRVRLTIAELCNGSTHDSDSCCLGSNPSSAASISLHGQAVKTSPSHGENWGSSPHGGANKVLEDRSSPRTFSFLPAPAEAMYPGRAAPVPVQISRNHGRNRPGNGRALPHSTKASAQGLQRHVASSNPARSLQNLPGRSLPTSFPPTVDAAPPAPICAPRSS